MFHVTLHVSLSHSSSSLGPVSAGQEQEGLVDFNEIYGEITFSASSYPSISLSFYHCHLHDHSRLVFIITLTFILNHLHLPLKKKKFLTQCFWHCYFELFIKKYHVFHKIMKLFLTLIIIKKFLHNAKLERFLKSHVTLKTGVIMRKIQLWNHMNKLHFRM